MDELTPRERAVGARIVTGLTMKEIAAELGIAPSTVIMHAKAIYRKAKVTSARRYVSHVLGGLVEVVFAPAASAVDVLQTVDDLRLSSGLRRLK